MAPPRVVGSALALAAVGAILAGCGGPGGNASGTTTSAKAAGPTAAQRVCRRARDAARPSLGATTLRIEGTDPAYIECLLTARGARVDVVAQATSQAWVEYDTTVVHQAQAYGSGGVHVAAQLPQPVPGMPGNASWIPARHELVATNGTESRGGSYVTVTVTPTAGAHRVTLPTARAVARAVLAVAPRGPNPAPPSG